MKVGIITFHRAYNYGAVLQCYSLSKYLNLQGYDCEVVDYFPQYFVDGYSLFPSKYLSDKTLKQKLYSIFEIFVTLPVKIRRYNKFKKFLSNIPLSSQQYNERNIDFQKYDIVIYGSDQIWNRKLTNGFDAVFTGSIKKNKSTKYITYAASTTLFDKNEEYNYYANIIKNFDYITVREESFNIYLNSIEQGISKCVLDPVFLLNKDQWKNIIKLPSKQKYILFYSVPTHPLLYDRVQEISQLLHLPVICLTAIVRLKSKYNCDNTASPEEFLGYFYNAEFVLTTSFHGTAFSVIFRKQFYTFRLGSDTDNRSFDLLNRFNMVDRFIDISEKVHDIKRVDFHNYEDLISKNISVSKDLLQSMIN